MLLGIKEPTMMKFHSKYVVEAVALRVRLQMNSVYTFRECVLLLKLKSLSMLILSRDCGHSKSGTDRAVVKASLISVTIAAVEGSIHKIVLAVKRTSTLTVSLDHGGYVTVDVRSKRS